MSKGFAVAIVVAAYLLGSIPFSYLIVRVLGGQDVRKVGSGNVGATNAMRAAGAKAGAIALLLDFSKGVGAVVLARLADAASPVVGAAAVAVMLGHVFPIFLGFRGGKGVATSAGAFAALAPLALVITLAVFVAIVAWKRYVSIGSITAAALFPLLVLALQRLDWMEPDLWLVAASAAIALIVIVKHRTNLARLRQGIEPKLGQRRSA
jgi:glycerol-3-phosphate acyltransferase PlsY